VKTNHREISNMKTKRSNPIEYQKDKSPLDGGEDKEHSIFLPRFTLLLVVAPIFLGGLRARLHTPIPHREPLTNTREVAINHEQSTRVGFGTPPRITTKPVTIKLV
jgi:hypothetical protein